MNVFITLDYELFFGDKTGTAQGCLINPTCRLLDVLDAFGVKATFFVDAGYLLRLDDLQAASPVLVRDRAEVLGQLRHLLECGHDLQLHVHPHWEDAEFDGGRWIVDTRRYRLHDFSESEIENIVGSYKASLSEIAGDRVFAFRAGGWCIQPFLKIRKALQSHGIWLDSTVFSGGFNLTGRQYFDFRLAPQEADWRFQSNPLDVQNDGWFLEVPISSYSVAPLFFWRLALLRKFGGERHRAFGDGRAVGGAWRDQLRALTRRSRTVVSIDGLKADLLEAAYRVHRTGQREHLVIIGHPKALTAHSLSRLSRFLANHQADRFCTLYEVFHGRQ